MDQDGNSLGLSAKEICDILKCCKKQGVSRLKIYGLEADFLQVPPGPETVVLPQFDSQPTDELDESVRNAILDYKLQELELQDPQEAERQYLEGRG